MQTPKTDCISCTNQSCLIYKHRDNKGIAGYLEKKTTFQCKEGQQFILEGAPVSGLYFIYDGCVKVFKHTANTDSQIIRFSKNGEVVGHRGFGTNYVYDISASALSNTVLCHFATDMLIEMLHECPPMMFDFMLFYADQLQKSEANAKRFAKMSVREKVINGLLFIKQKFGQTDGMFNIILSRKDIADFAGTSQEQVIRVISSLKKEGLLSSTGKRLGIPDEAKIISELDQIEYYLEG